MDASRTSFELLAHLDAHSPPPGESSCATSSRGILWVLKWAAALVVLFYAGCVLVRLGYSLSAERALLHAARAGALEATLPRATHETIVKTVERRLESWSISRIDLKVNIRRNGAPLGRVFRLLDDDRVTVTVAVPTEALLPRWLRALHVWNSGALLEATANRQTPGKRVRFAAR
jgi:hypothetical protein